MFEPSKVSAIGLLPTVKEVWVALTTKLKAFEGPPPGAGFVTTTVKLPAIARSPALSVIDNWPLLTKVEECVVELKVTVDAEMNPLPLISTVSGPDPAGAEVGVRPAIVGFGFCGMGPTAMVTVLDLALPIEITTGTATPTTPVGTRALTWYRPTPPGMRPENSTSAFAPPIVTIGVVVVSASVVLCDREPVRG